MISQPGPKMLPKFSIFVLISLLFSFPGMWAKCIAPALIFSAYVLATPNNVLQMDKDHFDDFVEANDMVVAACE